MQCKPRMVRDLLTGFVKEAWVEQLDFTSLEKVSGSYVTDDWKPGLTPSWRQRRWRPC